MGQADTGLGGAVAALQGPEGRAAARGFGSVPRLCNGRVPHVFFPQWKSCGKRLSRGREET